MKTSPGIFSSFRSQKIWSVSCCFDVNMGKQMQLKYIFIFHSFPLSPRKSIRGKYRWWLLQLVTASAFIFEAELFTAVYWFTGFLYMWPCLLSHTLIPLGNLNSVCVCEKVNEVSVSSYCCCLKRSFLRVGHNIYWSLGAQWFHMSFV